MLGVLKLCFSLSTQNTHTRPLHDTSRTQIGGSQKFFKILSFEQKSPHKSFKMPHLSLCPQPCSYPGLPSMGG